MATVPRRLNQHQRRMQLQPVSKRPDTASVMSHYICCGDNAAIMPALSGGFDLAFFDPPYNTGRTRHSYANSFGAEDWNEHIRTRLRMVWRLLADDAVLVATIDERSLGPMLAAISETIGQPVQIVTVRTLRSGTARPGFRRVSEFYLFVHKGRMRPSPVPLGDEWGLTSTTATGLTATAGDVRWNPLFRSGADGAPTPGCVYPIWRLDGRIVGIGGDEVDEAAEPIWPISGAGAPGRWRLREQKARRLLTRGLMRLGNTSASGRTPVYYLPQGQIEALESGRIVSDGLDDQGAQQLRLAGRREVLPSTMWDVPTHDYAIHGSRVLQHLVPTAQFSHPKSIYAVADALRMYPSTRVLDVYAGSGTTAHAVMMLNTADGGDRESVSIGLDESGAFHQVLAPRLRAATTTPMTYQGVLAGHVGPVRGQVVEMTTRPQRRAA